MSDDVKSKSANRRSLLEENFRQKRKLGLQRLRRFGMVSLLVSVVTIGFGCWNVVLLVLDVAEWPYVVPIGCIAGILAFIPSVAALHFATSGMRLEESGDRTRGNVPSSHKNQILVIFVSALYNFILLLLCCAGSVLGIVLCADDHSNCDAYSDSKMAISVCVTILSILLWFTSFFYTRWYFIYSRAFGFKSKAERNFNPKQAMELQKRQDESQSNHHTANQANGQPEMSDQP